ncbi:MAG: DUF1460 domain-containing protein [Odoribacter sp.]
MMRHFFLTIFCIVELTQSCVAVTLSEGDQQILRSFWKYAADHQLTQLPVNEKIPIVACFFIGTPYKSNTLFVTKENLPVINLRELDCVTFVENVLALSFLDTYNDQSIETFIKNITRLRYRNGEIIDYTSRLHYSSDWLYEMQKQHLLTDVTSLCGGILHPMQIDYMSKNYTRYPVLTKDKSLLKKIKTIEATINQRTYYYIPKDQITASCNQIKNGDILLITTNIKGLDTSHLGFAWKDKGKTYLLHASSDGKKVMISDLPLQEYMEGIKNQNGMMVARKI